MSLLTSMYSKRQVVGLRVWGLPKPCLQGKACKHGS